MLKAAYNAVGCKLNQYEVQAIAESLEPYGFISVPFTEKADLYIINSCTVTGKADYTSRQMARRALKKNPAAKVILTGCYAELEPDIAGAISPDIIPIGNTRKADIPQLVLDMFGIGFDAKLATRPITRMNGHSRAFIKIQEGCREQCSYCIIWKARGKPTSRPPEEIVEEINALYDNGYCEVVLTGVHIGRYKKRLNLAELLRAILEQTKMPRIRLSSLKPNEFKDELIELIGAEKRICAHVHLPIQSGDDDILKAMGRKYTAVSISQLTRRLAEARPEITIGADIIVGFPGETDANFENTLALVKNNPIHHLHVFSYSDRPGTPASQMNSKVDPETKAKRSARLRRLGNIRKNEHAEKFIGSTLDVVVEDRTRGGVYGGISGNYLRVEFDGSEEMKKKLIQIKIRSRDKDVLKGDSKSIKLTKKS
jgi:threonylcarbamoyladenosine tRNA methylthiotransferase MtaB